jgi:hypothetical protein
VHDPDLDRRLQPLRLVVAAMAVGIVTLAVVASVLAAGGSVSLKPELAGPLGLALGVFVVVAAVAYTLVRNRMIAGLRQIYEEQSTPDDTATELAPRYAAITIIGAALAEGPSLLGGIVVMLTGQWTALVVPGVGLVVLALLLPTRDRFASFVTQATGRSWP